MKRKIEEVKIRMADDSCLFCGLHSEIAGGHLFVGKRQKDGNLISDSGWLCIEHLATCAVQICPNCISKYQLVEPKAVSTQYWLFEPETESEAYFRGRKDGLIMRESQTEPKTDEYGRVIRNLASRAYNQEIERQKQEAIKQFIQSLIDEGYIIVTESNQWITGLSVGEALKAKLLEEK